jgi:hypothetical protein
MPLVLFVPTMSTPLPAAASRPATARPIPSVPPVIKAHLIVLPFGLMDKDEAAHADVTSDRHVTRRAHASS